MGNMSDSECWIPILSRLTTLLIGRDNYMTNATAPAINYSKLSESFQRVTPIASGFGNVPDDNYIGDLKEAILTTSKAGKAQVVMAFEIAMGDYEGKILKTFNGIEDDQGMGYFKNTSVEVMGMDLPPDVADWQEYFNNFVVNNVTDLYELGVKQQANNPQYQNVFINGVSQEFNKGGEAVVDDGTTLQEVDATMDQGAAEEVPEPQQVILPPKRTAAKPAAAPVAAAKKPAPVVQLPARKAAAPAVAVRGTARTVVSLKR